MAQMLEYIKNKFNNKILFLYGLIILLVIINIYLLISIKQNTPNKIEKSIIKNIHTIDELNEVKKNKEDSINILEKSIKNIDDSIIERIKYINSIKNTNINYEEITNDIDTFDIIQLRNFITNRYNTE